MAVTGVEIMRLMGPDGSERIEDHLDRPATDPAVRWSRVNAAEQFPGQISTLSWSVHSETSDEQMWRTFHAMGLLRKSEFRAATVPEDSFIGVRHGRYVANVDKFREVMDRMPGNAGDALEEILLGEKAAAQARRSRKRPFAMATHLPVALLRSPKAVRAVVEETTAWWRHWTRRIAEQGASAAREALQSVRSRAVERNVAVATAAFCQQAVFGALAHLLPAQSHQTLLRLPSGKVFPETEFAQAIWEYAHGKASREDVIGRFGYFTGAGADCSVDSLRSRPEQLDGLVAAFRDADPPVSGVQEAQAKRAALVAELVASVPTVRRPLVRWLLKQADELAYCREHGRSSWLQQMDVVRAAAIAIGEDLCAKGWLRSPRDAFHFTADELRSCDPAAMDAMAAYRKALRDWRDTFDLPNSFSGDPPLLTRREIDTETVAADADRPLAGMPASAGVARGVARVVRNPFEAPHFRRGDILVCRYTDPSWSAVISLAGGIVADIGGALSHGAIVAREMGVPAVVNTRDGTRRIPDGALIEIDGGTGRITLVAAEQ